MVTRRSFCVGVAASAVAWRAGAAEPPSSIIVEQDFDELWETLRARYCFFGEKQTDWERVRALYRPQALAAQAADSEAGVWDVIRRVLGEVYDAHTHLVGPPDGTPRWPLYDLLVERAAGDVRVAAVREGSAAEAAGVRLGERVIAVDGAPIATAAAALMPQCLRRADPEADAYALNCAVAGRRGMPRQLTVRDASGADRTVALPLGAPDTPPDVEHRRLDDGLGYIRIRTFSERSAVPAFDAALEALRDAPGLVLDTRDNGGGDTGVARPMMGRFIDATRPYAFMRRREGDGLSARWTERVEPRGPFTYTRPVVVLCDHWSASMAEGFPMGMRGLGRARVVGTPMMGLGAAVFTVRLDRTGIQAQYSAEPVYDVNDQPRWRMRPDVETAPGADILAAGVAELKRLIGG